MQQSLNNIVCYVIVPPTIDLDSKLMADVIRIRAGNVLQLEANVTGKPEPRVSTNLNCIDINTISLPLLLKNMYWLGRDALI